MSVGAAFHATKTMEMEGSDGQLFLKAVRSTDGDGPPHQAGRARALVQMNYSPVSSLTSLVGPLSCTLLMPFCAAAFEEYISDRAIAS